MAVKIDLYSAGVSALLRSPEAVAELRRRAQNIASAAGSGHGVDAVAGRNRARATVWTESWGAMWREARERNLSRAIDAGRS